MGGPGGLAVGVQTWSTDVRSLRRYWMAADRLGYDLVTYGDGLGAWTHDTWVMLGVLAAVTKRARIGSAVTYAFDASSHHPAWLAKRAVAVDHASDGRFDLRLGIGAENATTRAHWHAFGVPYPARRERLARLEESVTLLRRFWSGERVDHNGPFYAVGGARLAPRPVQHPGPPIWIAATRRSSLTTVARHGDGWEASYVDAASLAERWRIMRGALAAAGRSTKGFGRSLELDVVLATSRPAFERQLDDFCASRRVTRRHPLVRTALAGRPDDVVAQVKLYVAAGVTQLLLGFSDFPDLGMLTVFGTEVLPALRTMSGDAAERVRHGQA